jgi:hypothetical protein
LLQLLGPETKILFDYEAYNPCLALKQLTVALAKMPKGHSNCTGTINL